MAMRTEVGVWPFAGRKMMPHFIPGMRGDWNQLSDGARDGPGFSSGTSGRVRRDLGFWLGSRILSMTSTADRSAL